MKRREFLKLIAVGVPATICAAKLGIAKPRASVRTTASLLPGQWRVAIRRDVDSGVEFECEPVQKSYGVAYLCPFCRANVVEFRDGLIVGAKHARRCGELVLTSMFDVSAFRGHLDPCRIDALNLEQMNRDQKDAWDNVRITVPTSHLYRL